MIIQVKAPAAINTAARRGIPTDKPTMSPTRLEDEGWYREPGTLKIVGEMVPLPLGEDIGVEPCGGILGAVGGIIEGDGGNKGVLDCGSGMAGSKDGESDGPDVGTSDGADDIEGALWMGGVADGEFSGDSDG